MKAIFDELGFDFQGNLGKFFLGFRRPSLNAVDDVFELCIHSSP